MDLMKRYQNEADGNFDPLLAFERWPNASVLPALNNSIVTISRKTRRVLQGFVGYWRWPLVRCSWGVGPSPFLFCHKLQNGFSRFRNTNTRTQVQIHSNSIHKTFDKNLQYPLRLCCQPSRRFLGLTERKHNFKPRQLANVAFFLSLCFCDNVQQA